MMSTNRVNILAGNVMIVSSQDSYSAAACNILAQDYLRFTGDINKTVQLRPLSSQAVVDGSWARIKKLFGAWVESGEEDKQLEELYRSRLVPSSMPDEEE